MPVPALLAAIVNVLAMLERIWMAPEGLGCMRILMHIRLQVRMVGEVLWVVDQVRVFVESLALFRVRVEVTMCASR